MGEQSSDLFRKEVNQKNEQTGRITITYETLFDLVVREKSRDDLQTLQLNFFADLVGYLNEKRSMLNLMEPDEREKASRQLQNINRLVKELYERREKKILSLALTRSRAGADIVDMTGLLGEEKSMFANLVRELDFFRETVLNSVLTARVPSPASHHQSGAETLAAATRIITGQPTSAISGTSFGTSEGVKNETEASLAFDDKKTTRLIRFLHPVPRFVGRELEVYGPFDQEDIANLPIEIAEVLINKGRAEELANA